MSSIIYVTADAVHLEATKKLFAKKFPEIMLMLCSPDTDGSDIIAKAHELAADVIIARGALYTRLKKRAPFLHVLEAPVTALDTLRALQAAQSISTKIGAVASEHVMTGIRELAAVMELELIVYPLDKDKDPYEGVQAVLATGANVIVGGFLAKNAANAHAVPSVPIISHSEGLLEAAQKAQELVHAIRHERQRSVLLHALIDHTSDGIIACDANGTIVVCNPAAKRLLGISDVVGEAATQHVPELDLSQTIASTTKTLGRLLQHKGKDLVCSTVPVKVHGRTEAAVATVQDVRKIQQVEAHVRRSIYETGHKASMCFNNMIWRSAAMEQAIGKAKEFAMTNASVLLLGETGVGKELFAQSIHMFSSRKKGPFVAINCAALPGDLLESELFGYEAGAFTGANPKGKPGMFELAHGGTLFLDEIGEQAMHIQSKLLRVLEERKIMRLGSDKVLPVDVRLITATHRNLQECIRDQRFRADLYYRLNVLRLKIPPLRERADDIAVLAQAFLLQCMPRGKTPPTLCPDAVQVLQGHDWPGNVRELRNIMERIATLHKNDYVDGNAAASYLAEEKAELHTTVYDAELAEIYRVLAAYNGNQTKAAAALGMSRATLWRKLKKGI